MNKEEIAKFKNIQQSYLLDVESAKHNPQAIALEMMKLKQQLQAYKDKEDKLRELVKENEIEKVNEYHKNTYTSCLVNGYEVLQILNEGSDGE